MNYNKEMEFRIQELGARFGADFLGAIEQNKRDHEEDCRKSCEMYYCSDANAPLVPMEEILGSTTIKSYSMGPVPPEDFVSVYTTTQVGRLLAFRTHMVCIAYYCSKRLTVSGKIL